SDLYFRLAVVEVTLPPLRERLEDLPILVPRLLADICEKNGIAPAPLAAADLERLSKHYWPGNVRELRNMLERSVLLGAALDVADLTVPPETSILPAPQLPYREAKALVVERFEKVYVQELL